MKQLTVKEWVWQKIARENNVGRFWEDHIYAIFAETEKAYKVIMGSTTYVIPVWLPKSQCEWVETDNEDHETRFFDNYNEAMDHARLINKFYI